ncbi:MAG: D-2-hydroxyacid dehydrogenase, partial [Phycisphaerae bacterium]
MKIVVLDGKAMNPGDLSWEPLAALGELVVHERTSPADVVARADGAVAIITNKVKFGPAEFAALPELKYIGVTATGYNVVDVDAARAAGVTVTNVPAYSTMAVAQATFALLLHLTNHVADLNASVRTRWPQSPDFAYWDEPILELADKTLGIVGFGRIGRAVAKVGAALGMRVITHTRSEIDSDLAEPVGLDELFATSDVVSLHCPQTPETEHVVNAGRLSAMKPTAYLLNAGRGGLVDEDALAAALNEGQIAGAGLDVLTREPPRADNPLLSARNCVITPHVAWAAR